jgi:predicted dinucleotide-binding enzyme
MTRYAVLGTGMVGRAVAGKLAVLGHDVTMGTRDPAAARARTEADRPGQPSLAEWLDANPAVTLAAYPNAAAGADVLVNATAGSASLDALAAAGADGMPGAIVLDIANPLDFSAGELNLTVGITDSLGETIQRAFPDLRVVKTLNTVTASVMVDPASVGGGDHTMFVAGNDAGAKAEVTALLGGFGWRDVRDLGDISAARGMEAYLVLWLRTMQTFGTPMFNVKLVP